jgi:hypothetical protein
MEDENSILPPPKRTPWNKGKLIGASKSEVSGQSEHCSTRLLAALRARSGCEQSQQTNVSPVRVRALPVPD